MTTLPFRPGQLAKTTGMLRVEVPGLAAEYWGSRPFQVPETKPRYDDVYKVIPVGSVILLVACGLEDKVVEETWTTKKFGRLYVDFLWEEKTVRWCGYNFKCPIHIEEKAAHKQFATNFKNFFSILS